MRIVPPDTRMGPALGRAPSSSAAREIYVSRSSRTGSGVFGCAAGEYDG
jgi:hypothetical protein